MNKSHNPINKMASVNNEEFENVKNEGHQPQYIQYLEQTLQKT